MNGVVPEPGRKVPAEPGGGLKQFCEGGGENTRLGYVDPYTRGLAEETLNVLLDNFLTDPHYIFHR